VALTFAAVLANQKLYDNPVDDEFEWVLLLVTPVVGAGIAFGIGGALGGLF
jgi:hypothetical protein